MELFRSVLLGVIQGLTEFLPVSSSGHLALLPTIFRIEAPTLALAMSLHLGTLIAVVIYFYKDVINLVQSFFSIFKKERNSKEKKYLKLLILILVAIIPAVIFGVLFSDKVDQTFSKPRIVSVLFILNALLLFSAHLYSEKGYVSLENAGFKNAVLVGLFQVFALLPGISRSGSTISGGIFSKLRKEDSARFSFLISVPVVLGGALFEMKDLFKGTSQNHSVIYIFVGFFVSFLVGLISIRLLFNMLKKSKLYFFAVYCLIIGIIGLIFS